MIKVVDKVSFRFVSLSAAPSSDVLCYFAPRNSRCRAGVNQIDEAHAEQRVGSFFQLESCARSRCYHLGNDD